MIMELALATMSTVLRIKLVGLLEEKIKLEKKLKGHLKLLSQDLQTMHDALLPVSEMMDDGLAKEYQAKLLDLSYDIEDSIDKLILSLGAEDLEPHRCKRFIGKTMILLSKAKIRYRAAKEFQDLRRRVKEMTERCHMYTFDRVSHRRSIVPVDSRSPALYTDARSLLVGMDRPLNELAKLLTEEEPESAGRLKVVAILGSAGLGKTTLASEAYRTTQSYFDCRAWVTVTQTPMRINIFIAILRQIEDPRSIWGESERNLIKRIKAFLQDKRYIIVFDDMWSTETWEIIKSVLPLNCSGSRVITTTRINNIAESCCAHWNDCIYKIRPLSMNDSRKLFLGRIFGSARRCPPDLEDVSERILKKCSGLPLAITTISGLLANKLRTRSIWEDVYSCIGATPESIEAKRNISLLGYNDIPRHLKACLLYLSIFPRDYQINRKKLTRRWLAEGFILDNQDAALEDVCENCFDELASRSIIHPIHNSYDGIPDAYIIHDIVHELIKSISAEDNFITFLDKESVPNLHGKIRRLSIFSVDKGCHIPAAVTKSHVRSLSIFGCIGPKVSFKHLTFLRVLDLDGCMDLTNHNLEEIIGLPNLMYLSIRDAPISAIPHQIFRLQYLETLVLWGTEVQELPMSVARLPRLRHLLCDKMRFPEGIGRMETLSYLSQFDILQSKIFAVKELGDLYDLKELVIWWFPDAKSNATDRYDDLACSLYRLRKLHSLYIRGIESLVDFLDHLRQPLQQLRRVQLNGRCYVIRMPAWFRSLPSLTYVCIDIKEVKNEDLQLLSELASLIHVSLSSKEMPTEKLVISSGGFPVLREFHLHSARADLSFEPQAMQKLEELILSLHVIPQETYGFTINIDQFIWLKKIDIRIYGKGADASQMFKATDVAIRKAADEHPNNPIANIVMFA